MSDGNKRYLGDVFINAENKEIQRQFFKDVIESYQFQYGGEFNSAFLQGYTPEDFATKEQGEKADSAIISPLQIGQSEIINLQEPQYVLSDAIRLEDILKEETSEYHTWYQNDIDITDALKTIYEKVHYKLDTADFEDFKENNYNKFKNCFLGSCETFVDPDDQTKKILFNSSLVNGIRFILITQEKYDELPEETKKYWRNFFIIKDASEIPPDYHDPMELSLTDGYKFSLENDELIVTNNLSDTHKVICRVSDLIGELDVHDKVREYIEDPVYFGDTGYLIHDESLNESIKRQIDKEDVDNDYPFLSSLLKNDFTHDISLDNNNNYINTSFDSEGFKNVNIGMNNYLEDNLGNISEIENIENSITNVRSNIDDINDDIIGLGNDINKINTDIGNIQQKDIDQDQQFNIINNKLTNIETKISNLSNSLSKWVRIDNQTNQDAKYYANQALGIVYFWVYGIIESDSTSSYKNVPNLPAFPNNFRPKTTSYFHSDFISSTGIMLAISPSDGRIKYRSSVGAKKDNVKGFHASGMFIYQ